MDIIRRAIRLISTNLICTFTMTLGFHFVWNQGLKGMVQALLFVVMKQQRVDYFTEAVLKKAITEPLTMGVVILLIVVVLFFVSLEIIGWMIYFQHNVQGKEVSIVFIGRTALKKSIVMLRLYPGFWVLQLLIWGSIIIWGNCVILWQTNMLWMVLFDVAMLLLGYRGIPCIYACVLGERQEKKTTENRMKAYWIGVIFIMWMMMIHCITYGIEAGMLGFMRWWDGTGYETMRQSFYTLRSEHGYLWNSFTMPGMMAFFSSVHEENMLAQDRSSHLETGIQQETGIWNKNKMQQENSMKWKNCIITLFCLLSILYFNQNMRWYRYREISQQNIEITAHRGNSGIAPENTIASIIGAMVAKADAVELDVQETRDGVLIVFHDDFLDRITDRSGKVSQKTYGTIRWLDAGSWFLAKYQGEHIPTLEEVFILTNGRIKLNIEIKACQNPKQVTEHVLALIEQYHLEDSCVISSFSTEILKLVKSMNQNIQTGYIQRFIFGNLEKVTFADFFSLNQAFVTEELVKNIHKAGKQVHVWGVDMPQQVERMIQSGVDVLITDYPVMARNVADQSALYN